MELHILSNYYGWIFPDGFVLECDPYNHLKTLIDHPNARRYFGETYEEFDKWAQEMYEEASYNWTADLGPDDHPAWHAFDQYPETFKLEKIYGKGFIRFGTWDNQMETDSTNKPDERIILKLLDKFEKDKCICRDRSYYGRNFPTIKRFVE